MTPERRSYLGTRPEPEIQELLDALEAAERECAELRAERDRLREALEACVGCLDYSNYYCDCRHPACKICDYVDDVAHARKLVTAALAPKEPR